jgi:hypothetical protein
MPRTQRLVINDETTGYHAWDVEQNHPAILLPNLILLQHQY